MNNKDYSVIIIAAGCSRRLAHLTKEKPKPFLEVGNKKIIEHTLDYLNDRGFKDVTLIVGYLSDFFIRTMGNSYKKLKLNYVVSREFETTGHGWSLYLARDQWKVERKPVIFLHGDILYHPSILDQVLASPEKSIMSVDNQYSIITKDEVIVTGQKNKIMGFKWGIPPESPDAAGELIGVNKFSENMMGELFSFMEVYFAERGNNYNYEPVLDAFIKSAGRKIAYLQTNGLPWININYQEDYQKAKNDIYPSICSTSNNPGNTKDNS